jgi:hypothetical protein
VPGEVVVAPIVEGAYLAETPEAFDRDLDIELDPVVERAFRVALLEQSDPFGRNAERIAEEPELLRKMVDEELGQVPFRDELAGAHEARSGDTVRPVAGP